MKTIRTLFLSAALLPLVACGDSTPDTGEAPAAPSAPAAEHEGNIAPVKLEFLRVHLRSAHLIAEGATEVPGYRLAHQELHNEADGAPLLNHNGEPCTQGYWIETAESATEKGYYLCEKDVARAEADPARPEVIALTFTDEGSKKIEKLTSSFEIGREMLAIVVNGKVYAAPVVQDTISRQTSINGFLIPGERDAVVRSLQAATAGNEQPEDVASQAEPDEDAVDDMVEIEVDPELSETEQQAVRIYMLRRLLADVRTLRPLIAAREQATYGRRHELQSEALKAVPTDALPADYQAYVQACIRARENQQTLAPIADLPLLAMEHSPEQEGLLVRAVTEESEQARALAEAYPKAAAYISDSALLKTRDRFMSRPSFIRACIRVMNDTPPDTDDEAEREYQSALNIAEMMEAEICSMLEEEPEAPAPSTP